MWRIHYVFLLLNLWNKLLDPLRWHHEAHSSVSNMMINHWMIQQKCWSLWLSNKCTAKSVLSQDIMPGHKFHSGMIIQTQHQSTLKSKFMCSSYWHKHWNKLHILDICEEERHRGIIRHICITHSFFLSHNPVSFFPVGKMHLFLLPLLIWSSKI